MINDGFVGVAVLVVVVLGVVLILNTGNSNDGIPVRLVENEARFKIKTPEPVERRVSQGSYFTFKDGREPQWAAELDSDGLLKVHSKCKKINKRLFDCTEVKGE